MGLAASARRTPRACLSSEAALVPASRCSLRARWRKRPLRAPLKMLEIGRKGALWWVGRTRWCLLWSARDHVALCSLTPSVSLRRSSIRTASSASCRCSHPYLSTECLIIAVSHEQKLTGLWENRFCQGIDDAPVRFTCQSRGTCSSPSLSECFLPQRKKGIS